MKRTKVLVCPDKFRHCADSIWLTQTIGNQVLQNGFEAIELPLSDGGEGFLSVYGSALGANYRSKLVSNALGRPIEARWAIASSSNARGSKTAIIEMALACGLEVIGGASANRPLDSSTRGVGQLILEAIANSAKRIVVGCGGSATTDGGLGALEALRPFHKLKGIELICACDVKTKFTKAAEEFAGQKGATRGEIAFLKRRLERLLKEYNREFGVDLSDLEMAGAAGGLAGGLAAIGSKLVSGIDLIMESCRFEELLLSADLVITGEGLLDESSYDGKVVGKVLELAKRYDKPVLVVVGAVDQDMNIEREGADIVDIVCIPRVDDEPTNSESFGSAVQLEVRRWLDTSKAKSI